MKFYSINKHSPLVDFKDATILGQAPDKGLYFPEQIPMIDQDLLTNIENYSNEEIAFKVIEPYVGDSIPTDKLMQIVVESIDFPIPLYQINERIFSLELFHGPTLAFKDIGARFMSRCLGHFVKHQDKRVTVLVATSGDTGGAVANGFYEVEGIDVVILYPSGKVSQVQEKQLTTLGRNVHALEIAGTFDDCQQLVKQAFGDAGLNRAVFLTSANSINVARWLPQQFYYFLAWKQWPDKDHPPVFSVPSGNFGNICAGLLAQYSGLPARHFIAACNANDVVTKYLETANYKAQEAIATLSNAMDVGDPSNFIRIQEIFKHQYPEIIKNLDSFSITDDETKATINRIFHQYSYTLDPHGAVGYLSLERWLDHHPGASGIFLETAHPVKFPEAVESATGKKLDLPASVHEMMGKRKSSLSMSNKYEELKQFLLN